MLQNFTFDKFLMTFMTLLHIEIKSSPVFPKVAKRTFYHFEIFSKSPKFTTYLGYICQKFVSQTFQQQPFLVTLHSGHRPWFIGQFVQPTYSALLLTFDPNNTELCISQNAYFGHILKSVLIFMKQEMQVSGSVTRLDEILPLWPNF